MNYSTAPYGNRTVCKVQVWYGTVWYRTVRYRTVGGKATLPYYLKRVRDPVPFLLTLLKVFLTAICEKVKPHVLKRKYLTIFLMMRDLRRFSM
jgi:hypothetical protein